MSYIKIKKIKKEVTGTNTPIEVPEQGYIYLGYDDSSVGGIGQGLWIIDDDGTESRYVLSGLGSNPTINSIDPSNSSYIGNTITLNGTNFINGSTIVTFGGVSATTVTFLSPTLITVVVPDVLGTISVVATTIYGNSSPFEYTINYQSVKPVIVPPITPTQASIGSQIYIGGYNFVPGNTITWFNGVTGETTATSSTYLTATVPQMQSGSTIIYLETPYGKSSPPVDYYITDDNPTFTGFYPSSGYIGDTIAISGTNFVQGEVQVRFGSVQASAITWHSAGYVTAKIANRTPFGDLSIRVQDISLTGFTVLGSTVGLLPTINSILPLSPSIGDTVTLSGNNFNDTVSVLFSGEYGTILSQSQSHLSVYLNTNISPGINSVIATNQYGNSNTFSYTISTPALGPVITSFNPATEDRGRPVNLLGSNFKVGSGNAVYYGNVATAVSGDANTSLVKTQIPLSSQTGTVDVKIVNTSGSYTKSGFVITTTGSTPTITYTSPIYAKAGDAVQIYGTNLSGCTISFGSPYPGTLSSTVTVIDNTHLSVIIPSGLVSAGQNKLVNVYAVGENGTYKYTPFEVYSPVTSYPNILSFSPSSGSTGTLVTISGSSFAKYFTDITIYNAGTYYVLDNQVYVSSTEITGYIPYTYGNIGISTIRIDTPIGSDQKSSFTIT